MGLIEWLLSGVSQQIADTEKRLNARIDNAKAAIILAIAETDPADPARAALLEKLRIELVQSREALESVITKQRGG